MMIKHSLTTAVALATIALMPGPSFAAPSSVPSTATDKIRDLTAMLKVVDKETNFNELKKIGGAFATTYRFKRMDITYKNPNKARFEARIMGAGVTMVYNGDMKMFRIPLRKQVKNVANEPGQKQTLMDLGIFARDYLTTDYSASLLRREGPLLVYKLSQRNTDNQSHEVVWVNPKTSLIERRQSINGQGKLQKEMRFKKAVRLRPGIWVPTRLEVYNQYGKLGAVQALENVKVNLGVDDSVFAIS